VEGTTIELDPATEELPEIEVRLEDHQPWTRRVEALESTELQVELEPLPEPEPQPEPRARARRRPRQRARQRRQRRSRPTAVTDPGF
jgi:hypothetical protein